MTWLFLKLINTLIASLKSKESLNSIATGIVLGSFCGLIPSNFTAYALIIFLFCIFRITVSAGFFGFIFGSLFSFIIIPLTHHLGLFLLTHDSLNSFWTTLMNMPFFPLLSLNNSVVLGQYCLFFCLSIPLFKGSKKGILYLRESVYPKIENSSWLKAFKLSKFGKWAFRLWSLAT
ncbi:hypothetical protein DID78_06530 [Candidatus Marinamargulisbacteria bacterium SCGC AG-343-D04]|nr:hypothetical protein DID78_06530 [Candidatus Marinamargulisbacteria bacterium SCGC AG-343-D04]